MAWLGEQQMSAVEQDNRGMSSSNGRTGHKTPTENATHPSCVIPEKDPTKRSEDAEKVCSSRDWGFDSIRVGRGGQENGTAWHYASNHERDRSHLQRGHYYYSLIVSSRLG